MQGSVCECGTKFVKFSHMWKHTTEPINNDDICLFLFLPIYFLHLLSQLLLSSCFCQASPIKFSSQASPVKLPLSIFSSQTAFVKRLLSSISSQVCIVKLSRKEFIKLLIFFSFQLSPIFLYTEASL